MLSGTSIVVMSHCDIHHECTRREPIIFSVWKVDIILDLDVTQLDFDKNKSPTEVWGSDHRENETGYD